MHLDTAMTIIDRGTFVLYPHLGRYLRSWTVTPGDQPGGRRSVARNRSLLGYPRGPAGRR